MFLVEKKIDKNDFEKVYILRGGGGKANLEKVYILIFFMTASLNVCAKKRWKR